MDIRLILRFALGIKHVADVVASLQVLRTLRVLAQELFVDGVEIGIGCRNFEVLLDGIGNGARQWLFKLVDWKN